MLAPAERRLLLDVLAPPAGYRLDHAVGTTYSLDLLALLRVPLAATALPWSNSDGEPVSNPFALLTALRRSADRISLFCHAGVTKVPAQHVPLLAFFEGVVHPVTPPNPGGVFHPKCWLLRFAPHDVQDVVRYRLLVLSRNLTFDRSWDVALALNGELRDRPRRQHPNRPLSAFFASLPAMTRAAGHELPASATARVQLLASEALRVDWELPEAFEGLTFHPIGHDGKPRWPVDDLYRLTILSPFLSGKALGRLATGVRTDIRVISRFDELAKLDRSVIEGLDSVDVFDDGGSVLDVGDAGGEPERDGEESDRPDLLGLHAKVFVGERHRRAVVYLGSANATEAAFDRNVEFLVELDGWRTHYGIDAAHDALSEANLLRPFKPSDELATDDPGEAVLRRMERVAHALCSGGLRATVTSDGEARWRTRLDAFRPVDLDGFQIYGRPLSEPGFRRLDLDQTPAATFAPVGLSSVTAFFALRVAGHDDAGDEVRLDTAARLPCEGLPGGRAEAVTAELLSDSDRLLRFMLLLLAEDQDIDAVLKAAEPLFGDGPTGPGGSATAGLPLLEPMLRALHQAPERLDEIDRLLADMRDVGASTVQLLPPELEELWATISEVRRSRE